MNHLSQIKKTQDEALLGYEEYQDKLISKYINSRLIYSIPFSKNIYQSKVVYDFLPRLSSKKNKLTFMDFLRIIKGVINLIKNMFFAYLIRLDNTNIKNLNKKNVYDEFLNAYHFNGDNYSTYFGKLETSANVYIPRLCNEKKILHTYLKLKKSPKEIYYKESLVQIGDLLYLLVEYVKELNLLIKNKENTSVIKEFAVTYFNPYLLEGLLTERLAKYLSKIELNKYVRWYEGHVIDRSFFSNLEKKENIYAYIGVILDKDVDVYIKFSNKLSQLGILPQNIIITQEFMSDEYEISNTETTNVFLSASSRLILENNGAKGNCALVMLPLVKDIEAELLILASKINLFCSLVIRKHPKSETIIEKKLHVSGDSLLSDFSKSNIVITSASSILYESLLQGKQTILYVNPKKIIHIPLPSSLRDAKNLKICTSEIEVEEIVRGLVHEA